MPAVDDGIVFAGSWEGVNGTSWGSPEFAAMLAEVYQYCGTAFTNATEIPYLVNGRAAAATAFIDITKGNNRFTSVSATAYTAGVGYDNATGLGVPLGLPFAQTFCPNGSPVYGASLRRARAQSTLRPRVARSYLVNATPNVSRTSMQGRKAQSEPVRIALVLRSSASIASDERSAIGVLRGAGFSIQRTFANHLVIDAIAPSAKVEQLFATEMHNVGQGQFGIRYFPATPVTIPASLAPYIAGAGIHSPYRLKRGQASASGSIVPWHTTMARSRSYGIA
jgi:hypothetical protein